MKHLLLVTIIVLFSHCTSLFSQDYGEIFKKYLPENVNEISKRYLELRIKECIEVNPDLIYFYMEYLSDESNIKNRDLYWKIRKYFINKKNSWLKQQIEFLKKSGADNKLISFFEDNLFEVNDYISSLNTIEDFSSYISKTEIDSNKLYFYNLVYLHADLKTDYDPSENYYRLVNEKYDTLIFGFESIFSKKNDPDVDKSDAYKKSQKNINTAFNYFFLFKNPFHKLSQHTTTFNFSEYFTYIWNTAQPNLGDTKENTENFTVNICGAFSSESYTRMIENEVYDALDFKIDILLHSNFDFGFGYYYHFRDKLSSLSYLNIVSDFSYFISKGKFPGKPVFQGNFSKPNVAHFSGNYTINDLLSNTYSFGLGVNTPIYVPNTSSYFEIGLQYKYMLTDFKFKDSGEYDLILLGTERTKFINKFKETNIGTYLNFSFLYYHSLSYFSKLSLFTGFNTNNRFTNASGASYEINYILK